MRLLHFFIIICLVAGASAGMGGPQDVIKRFALVVGANNGGADRVKLRYAISDAAAVMSVLRGLGGVEEENSLLLIEPRKARFMKTLDVMRNRINEARKKYRRVELVFYYSGHSDEEGILLSGDKIFYRDIKQTIMNAPADVRIAILDSCSSGAFTSIKGGKMRSPFLVDRSHSMKGFAFMTSSSSNEASQESDRIKGSFFTHYLLTGLRGAADLAGDGRITLNEAYQFAYAETLAHTEKTLRGPQHPNYNIMMSGAGDVVLTDIRKSSSTLVFSEQMKGKIFLRDRKKILIAELNKNQGKNIMLGLEHGSYTVLNDREGKLYETSVNLLEGSSFSLSNNSFAAVDREQARARGDDTANQLDGASDTAEDVIGTDVPQSGRFINSYVRISIYGGGGIIQGGVSAKERRYFNAFKPDLSIAYIKMKGYKISNVFVNAGPEVDVMAPGIHFPQKKKFGFSGIKAGIRMRYGYELSPSIIALNTNEDEENPANSMFKGDLMNYHYWCAGPVLNFIFSPQNNRFDFILSLFATGGQVFGGKLHSGSALRDAKYLWLRLGGFYGVPLLSLNRDLFILQSSRLNATRIRGYTIRGGISPEICVNKYVPVIIGLHITFAYTSLTFGRAMPVYFDCNKKAAHTELGGEVSVGVHI